MKKFMVRFHGVTDVKILTSLTLNNIRQNTGFYRSFLFLHISEELYQYKMASCEFLKLKLMNFIYIPLLLYIKSNNMMHEIKFNSSFFQCFFRHPTLMIKFNAYLCNRFVNCSRKENKKMKMTKMITTMALFIISALFCDANAQIEKADYLWIVDVSGNRNIYIEGMQNAIDTFYIETTKRDNLHVYNFAKTLNNKDDIVDSDYDKYSDLACMLQGLDSLIKNSKSRYVRAFILSDFYNDVPGSGDIPLNTIELSYLKGALMNDCHKKDVKIHLLILPPSSRYGGYSLNQVLEILPGDCTDKFATTPDLKTVDYLKQQIDEINKLRGITDEEQEPSSPIVTYIVLGLLLATLIGIGTYFFAKCNK